MAMTLLTTNTSSNAASSSFTSGIDSTYKLYIFKFIDINPVTDNEQFTFNGSTDGGSNYNVTKTTTLFGASNDDADSATELTYETTDDLAQSATAARLARAVGNLADESAAGTLWLFNPSNTTYVKHFYSRVNEYRGSEYSADNFAAGYFNTTSAINAVQFAMDSGNFDGTIKMYGVG